MGVGGFYGEPVQVEYLLSEWVRRFHQPGMLREGDKIYAAYVARVSSPYAYFPF